MELWIRSQDKEILLKTKNISIDNENWVLGNLISDDNKCICDYWRLGHYATKERALEVLDEMKKIIGWLQKDMKDVTIRDLKSLIGSFDDYVYEMPEE